MPGPYAARAGMKCCVLIPGGNIALGKLAQAIVHGANVLAIEGNFDEALCLVRVGETLEDLGTVCTRDLGGAVIAVIGHDANVEVVVLDPSQAPEETSDHQLLVVRGYEHREPMPRPGRREAWRPQSGQRESEEISAAEQRRHGGHR